MPIGTATLNFGNAPTAQTEATVAVTGQAGITATSAVEAFLMLDTVADPNGHSGDEHYVENLKLRVGSLIAGTGFTIYAECILGTTQGQFTAHWVWA